jgi:hypothetical protein
MLTKALLAASLGLLAVGANAQCATLSTSGSGAPGTTLSFNLDGTTPNAFAWLVVGDTQGSTPINLGSLGSVTLGIALPATIAPMGWTDTSGNASLSLTVPSVPGLSVDLFAQGVTLGVTIPTLPGGGGPGGGGPGGGGIPTIGFTLCASNVVAFHLGS